MRQRSEAIGADEAKGLSWRKRICDFIFRWRWQYGVSLPAWRESFSMCKTISKKTSFDRAAGVPGEVHHSFDNQKSSYGAVVWSCAASECSQTGHLCLYICSESVRSQWCAMFDVIVAQYTSAKFALFSHVNFVICWSKWRKGLRSSSEVRSTEASPLYSEYIILK